MTLIIHRWRYQILTFFIPLAVLATGSILRAQDIKPGDKVTVIKWDAEFRSDNTVVGTSPLGGSYVVDKVNGDWLWVSSRKGYLRRVDVVPYDKAIDHFTAAIRQEPTSSVAYNNRAVAWDERGEYDIAIGDYSEAIRLNPQDDNVYCNRGITWTNKGELDKAIADYSEAIRLNPGSDSAYCKRGAAWKNKGELDKAISDYSEAIRLNPQDEENFRERAAVFIEKYEYERASRDLSQAIAINPSSWHDHHQLCYLHLRRKDWAEVIKVTTRTLELDDATVSNLYRGMAYLHVGRYKDAEVDLHIALETESEGFSRVVTCTCAQVHAATGRHTLALEQFQKITAASEKTRYQCAFSAFLSGCPDGNFRDGNRALKLALEAKDTDAGFVELREAKAAAYAECGDFENAVAFQNEAITLAERQKLHETYIATQKERLALFESGKPYRFPVVKLTEEALAP